MGTNKLKRYDIMTQLQEITIKVPLTIAEAYNQADEEKKQEIINKITFFLQPITTDKQVAICEADPFGIALYS
jgi:hypothetical protein